MSTRKYARFAENRSARSIVVHEQRVEVELAGGVVLDRHDERMRRRTPLTTRPTMYAVWLRKNGDDSTWIWWLASRRNGRGKRRRNAASTLREVAPKSAKRRSKLEVEHEVDQRVAQPCCSG